MINERARIIEVVYRANVGFLVLGLCAMHSRRSRRRNINPWPNPATADLWASLHAPPGGGRASNYRHSPNEGQRQQQGQHRGVPDLAHADDLRAPLRKTPISVHRISWKLPWLPRSQSENVR
jgi:hypothetical protein